jgi:signal transduction histidine kinase
MNLSPTFPEDTKLFSPAILRRRPKSFRVGEIQPQRTNPFTSALVHEVRNPLSNIKLSLEMLKSAIGEVDRKRYIDIIARGSDRINELITDFLRFTETREIEMKRHPIQRIIDEALEMARDRIVLREIQVRKVYSKEDCEIFVDEREIKIALTNILINAIDAMTPGKGRLNLLTRVMDGKIVLEIEDNGIGISREGLEVIFKPYFTSKQGGMGLGLSTTLAILSSNHVGIDVQSAVGRGSRFILSFQPAIPSLHCGR